MKTRLAAYAQVLWLTLAIFLTPLLSSSAVLSGRVTQSPGPAAINTRTTVTPASKKSAASGVEYELIFPTRSVGTSKTFKSEDEAVRASKFDAFIEQLNKAGAEGYRLASFVYAQSGLPVGVVKRTATRYEYTWLAVQRGYYWFGVAEGSEQKFVSLSHRGFRLADYAHIEFDCVTFDPLAVPAIADPTGNSCSNVNVFLFEREVGVEKPARFAVLALGWLETQAPAVTELRRKLAEGLFPKLVFAGYDIWFDEEAGAIRPWSGYPEIELVRYESSWWGSDINTRVNKLAKGGYRIGLTNWDTVVMYRNPGSGGFNYHWVDAKKKSFEKGLARLQAKGAVYVTAYKDENKLIFERRLSDDGKRREYRVLKFEFAFAEDAGGNRGNIAITAQGKESLGVWRDLVEEGFTVRDLFLSGRQVGAIFERTR